MPQEIFKEINASVTPDTILTADVGLNQMWAAHFYDSTKPRTFITSGGLGTMGFGFPAAIGAKVAMPDNPVLSIVGDGGFLMVNQELATIKEYDIPVIVAILNNRKLGMVYQWQNLLYDQRLSETDMGNTPDFVKLAESYGVAGQRITDTEETGKAVSKAIKDNESIQPLINLLQLGELSFFVLDKIPFIYKLSPKIKYFKEQFIEIQNQSSILTLPDQFNKLFSKEGWICYGALSKSILDF